MLEITQLRDLAVILGYQGLDNILKNHEIQKTYRLGGILERASAYIDEVPDCVRLLWTKTSTNA